MPTMSNKTISQITLFYNMISRIFFKQYTSIFLFLLKYIQITCEKNLFIIQETDCTVAGKRKGRDSAFNKAVDNMLWFLFVLGQDQNTKELKEGYLYFSVSEGFFKEFFYCSYCLSRMRFSFLFYCLYLKNFTGIFILQGYWSQWFCYFSFELGCMIPIVQLRNLRRGPINWAIIFIIQILYFLNIIYISKIIFLK